MKTCVIKTAVGISVEECFRKKIAQNTRNAMSAKFRFSMQCEILLRLSLERAAFLNGVPMKEVFFPRPSRILCLVEARLFGVTDLHSWNHKNSGRSEMKFNSHMLSLLSLSSWVFRSRQSWLSRGSRRGHQNRRDNRSGHPRAPYPHSNGK